MGLGRSSRIASMKRANTYDCESDEEKTTTKRRISRKPAKSSGAKNNSQKKLK